MPPKVIGLSGGYPPNRTSSFWPCTYNPAGDGCESTQTFAAAFNRNFESRMPNVLSGIFKPMAAVEIVATLSLLFPARLDERPLSYSQAKALAGREPQPFEVIDQQPAAGVGVLASLGSPQAVRLSYWDPSDDAVRQKCEPKSRVRAKGQKTKGLTIAQALIERRVHGLQASMVKAKSRPVNSRTTAAGSMLAASVTPYSSTRQSSRPSTAMQVAQTPSGLRKM